MTLCEKCGNKNCPIEPSKPVVTCGQFIEKQSKGEQMITMDTSINDALKLMKGINAGVLKLRVRGKGAVIFMGDEEADELFEAVEAIEEQWEESK